MPRVSAYSKKRNRNRNRNLNKKSKKNRKFRTRTKSRQKGGDAVQDIMITNLCRGTNDGTNIKEANTLKAHVENLCQTTQVNNNNNNNVEVNSTGTSIVGGLIGGLSPSTKKTKKKGLIGNIISLATMPVRIAVGGFTYVTGVNVPLPEILGGSKETETTTKVVQTNPVPISLEDAHNRAIEK